MIPRISRSSLSEHDTRNDVWQPPLKFDSYAHSAPAGILSCRMIAARRSSGLVGQSEEVYGNGNVAEHSHKFP